VLGRPLTQVGHLAVSVKDDPEAVLGEATRRILADAAGRGIARTVVLSHAFVTGGSINGSPVQFMVDTGASVVALSEADAARIGLEFKNNPRFMVNTANGQVPAHSATIDVIRVGDVQVYNIEAVVVPASMPNVLLGNSFLTRFQMKRENDRMTLDKRP
jgi:aspartyl protease family protein